MISLSLKTTPIHKITINGNEYFIKRDDLANKLLSGNKYRKLFSLINKKPSDIKKVISFGGAQSNAMLSIAALCNAKGWDFDYTIIELPKNLLKPTGNLKIALELGMNLKQVSPEKYKLTTENILNTKNPTELIIPQGGAFQDAEPGISNLASEILKYQRDNKTENLKIVTPSGTGTTAYYLAKNLPNNEIYTIPLVRGKAYLEKQMLKLGYLPKNLNILTTKRKFYFAKPDKDHYTKWKEINKSGVIFDLVYAPKMWIALEENGISDNVLYIHSGGVLGNESMIERYKNLRTG